MFYWDIPHTNGNSQYVNVLWYPSYVYMETVLPPGIFALNVSHLRTLIQQEISNWCIPQAVPQGLFVCKCFHSSTLILHNTQLLEVYAEYMPPKWISVSWHKKRDVKIKKIKRIQSSKWISSAEGKSSLKIGIGWIFSSALRVSILSFSYTSVNWNTKCFLMALQLGLSNWYGYVYQRGSQQFLPF